MTWTYPEGIKIAEWDETIKAKKYVGDGSLLTGIVADAGITFPLVQASGGTGTTSVLQVAYPLIQASGGTGTTTALQVAYPLIEASGGTASTTSGAARLVLGIADSGALQATITDQGTSGSAYYANVVYNTTSSGVTASAYPIGSILVVYAV